MADEIKKQNNSQALVPSESAGKSETYSTQEKEAQTTPTLPQLEDKISDLDKKIESAKTTNVEVLAIFVAFFTFVSIEFQIVRQFDYLQFLYFSIFFSGLLTSFILLLDLTITKKLNVKSTLLMLLALVAILISFTKLSEVKIPPARPQALDIEKINTEQIKIDPRVR